jgi:hypothetical protein
MPPPQFRHRPPNCGTDIVEPRVLLGHPSRDHTTLPRRQRRGLQRGHKRSNRARTASANNYAKHEVERGRVRPVRPASRRRSHPLDSRSARWPYWPPTAGQFLLRHRKPPSSEFNDARFATIPAELLDLPPSLYRLVHIPGKVRVHRTGLASPIRSRSGVVGQ